MEATRKQTRPEVRCVPLRSDVVRTGPARKSRPGTPAGDAVGAACAFPTPLTPPQQALYPMGL